jgi:hypothetical protein
VDKAVDSYDAIYRDLADRQTREPGGDPGPAEPGPAEPGPAEPEAGGFEAGGAR